MAVTQLPDFEQALAQSGGGLDCGDLAECHGIACGLICRAPDGGADEYLRLLAKLELVAGPDAEFQTSLEQLHRTSAEQLGDEQMRLALWLPSDEESLEERTQALGRWCTGFLAALGSGAGVLQTLSEEASEVLRDLAQIARAEVSGEGDPEEEETAFAEIVEYVRVAALLLREDLRGPAGGERIH